MPVATAQGYTYERSALASHFAAEETEIDASVGAAAITSPITGEPLGTMVTFPNRQVNQSSTHHWRTTHSHLILPPTGSDWFGGDGGEPDLAVPARTQREGHAG